MLALYGLTDPIRTMTPNIFKISSKNLSSTMPCSGTLSYGKRENERCSCFDNLEVEDVFIKSLNILKQTLSLAINSLHKFFYRRRKIMFMMILQVY